MYKRQTQYYHPHPPPPPPPTSAPQPQTVKEQPTQLHSQKTKRKLKSSNASSSSANTSSSSSVPTHSTKKPSKNNNNKSTTSYKVSKRQTAKKTKDSKTTSKKIIQQQINNNSSVKEPKSDTITPDLTPKGIEATLPNSTSGDTAAHDQRQQSRSLENTPTSLPLNKPSMDPPLTKFSNTLIRRNSMTHFMPLDSEKNSTSDVSSVSGGNGNENNGVLNDQKLKKSSKSEPVTPLNASLLSKPSYDGSESQLLSTVAEVSDVPKNILNEHFNINTADPLLTGITDDNDDEDNDFSKFIRQDHDDHGDDPHATGSQSISHPDGNTVSNPDEGFDLDLLDNVTAAQDFNFLNWTK